MEKHDLSLKVFKFDFDYILDNFLNRKLWDKSWTIFEYDGYIIDVQLYRIDITDARIVLRVSLKGKYNTNSYLWLPYKKEARNKKVFTNNLLGTCITLIEYAENQKIYGFKSYKDANELTRSHNKLLREIANTFLTENNVTNDTIRSAYIDWYVDDNYLDYSSEVVSARRYKHLTGLYLTLCLYFGNRERYERITNNINMNTNRMAKLETEIQEFIEKIKTNDYRETMVDGLEAIVEWKKL